MSNLKVVSSATAISGKRFIKKVYCKDFTIDIKAITSSLTEMIEMEDNLDTVFITKKTRTSRSQEVYGPAVINATMYQKAVATPTGMSILTYDGIWQDFDYTQPEQVERTPEEIKYNNMMKGVRAAAKQRKMAKPVKGDMNWAVNYCPICNNELQQGSDDLWICKCGWKSITENSYVTERQVYEVVNGIPKHSTKDVLVYKTINESPKFKNDFRDPNEVDRLAVRSNLIQKGLEEINIAFENEFREPKTKWNPEPGLKSYPFARWLWKKRETEKMFGLIPKAVNDVASPELIKFWNNKLTNLGLGEIVDADIIDPLKWDDGDTNDDVGEGEFPGLSIVEIKSKYETQIRKWESMSDRVIGYMKRETVETWCQDHIDELDMVDISRLKEVADRIRAYFAIALYGMTEDEKDTYFKAKEAKRSSGDSFNDRIRDSWDSYKEYRNSLIDEKGYEIPEYKLNHHALKRVRTGFMTGLNLELMELYVADGLGMFIMTSASEFEPNASTHVQVKNIPDVVERNKGVDNTFKPSWTFKVCDTSELDVEQNYMAMGYLKTADGFHIIHIKTMDIITLRIEVRKYGIGNPKVIKGDMNTIVEFEKFKTKYSPKIIINNAPSYDDECYASLLK